MKSQMEADRAEQQRIKNLVLNYDLQDSTDQDGITYENDFILRRNPNLSNYYFHSSGTIAHEQIKGLGGDKHQYNATLHQSANHGNKSSDRMGTNRAAQRGRRLQLSDVDWYDATI